MKLAGKIAAALAALAAIVVLVYIFLLSDDKAAYTNDPTEQGTIAGTSDAVIHLDSDSLTYDGEGELDLMEGVRAEDKDGTNLTNQVYASMKSGDTLSEKIIQYSVEDANGNLAYATRTLHLKNYSGPSIQIQNPPSIYKSQLANLPTMLQNSGVLKADDGFGNDITASVTSTYVPDPTVKNAYLVTFSVTNLYNDLCSEKASFPLILDGPIVMLTTNAVTLEQGSTFRPADYVASASDPNDGDISSSVTVQGDLDMKTPGTYTLQFSAVNSNGEQADPETLVVTVK